MARTDKSLRIHVAREAEWARGYCFYSYLRGMERATRDGDTVLYDSERALLTAMFDDMNKRLFKAEAK